MKQLFLKIIVNRRRLLLIKGISHHNLKSAHMKEYTPSIQSYLAGLVYLLRVVMGPLSGFRFLSLYQMTSLTLELFLDHWNQQYR